MNSENPVLAALIAGISTVIVGFLSLFSSPKNTDVPSQKKIYELELNSVWEPLDNLLSYQTITDSFTVLQKIESIIAENYKMIPPEFIKEFNRLKLYDRKHTPDFSKLEKITASYFNWIRKYLGYPFDRKKILIEYSPTSGRDIFITAIGHGLLIIAVSVVSIIMLFSIMMLYENDRLSSLDLIALLTTLLGIVLSLNLIIYQQKK